MKDPSSRPDTFENTYPKYPFSELVRLSLIVAGWIAGRRVVVETKPHQPAQPCRGTARTPCARAIDPIATKDKSVDLALRRRKPVHERLRSR